MAFCKFCGKEIPEGGVCDCAAAQGQNAANNTFDQANNVFNNDNNNGGKKGIDVNDTINKVKGNPTLLIGGVAVVLVLILLLIFILGHTGAKGAAKSYAKSITKKGKGKTYYSLTLPDDKIKDLKDDDDWKDKIEDYNDGIKDSIDDGYKYKLKSVKKGKKLSKTALKGAEKYWKENGADDPEAKKGYEYKIRVQVKHDGDKKTKTEKVCVVKFKGEGWKVIEYSADDLKEMGED